MPRILDVSTRSLEFSLPVSALIAVMKGIEYRQNDSRNLTGAEQGSIGATRGLLPEHSQSGGSMLRSSRPASIMITTHLSRLHWFVYNMISKKSTDGADRTYLDNYTITRSTSAGKIPVHSYDVSCQPLKIRRDTARTVHPLSTSRRQHPACRPLPVAHRPPRPPCLCGG